MWEYRLIWTGEAPSWWDAAWRAGEAALRRHGRTPETRPDTYLVLADRPDVGLKTRGAGGEFEAKLRHQSELGWELWEKIPFFRWDDLEITRFSVALQQPLPQRVEAATPVDGVKAALAAMGIAVREVTVAKTRLQTRAGELLPALGREAADPGWLAELVEIEVPGKPAARSLCFEAMRSSGAAPPVAHRELARNAGYPAYLAGAS
ncbi:MAG TPA: hypothetical protein VFK57_21230 [Vicinamibacterales bacterium]|nr:hypothetical protein [Vicinamibacterales bacterium]